jgi:hypothetical protein
MRDPVEFLLEQANELRRLAAIAPIAAAEMRRIAEELENKARELEQQRRR